MFVFFFARFDRCEDVNSESDVPEIEYSLVLRKWKQLHPGGEFRCFVKNKQLVGEFGLLGMRTTNEFKT